MIIANPIYDVVFKSLMEDVEIARGLISTLTGLDVVELHARPRETSIPVKTDFSVTIYRLDYVALVRNTDASQRRVLIEVQKAKVGSEIRRFREYLGRQYMTPEIEYTDRGVQNESYPPIITIYILGFKLGDEIAPYAKVDRRYIDVITGDSFKSNNEFLNCLTHDMYVLQATRISHEAKTDLERILSVFSQSDFASDNEHKIEYPDPLAKAKNKLLKRLTRHLTKLSGSPEIQERMEAEDEGYKELADAVRLKTKELSDEISEERRQKEESQKREEEERQQKEESQKREEVERRQKEEERRQKELLKRKLITSGISEEEIQALLNR
jgi:hypothetical protein